MNPAEPVTTDNDTIDVIALWRLLWGNRFLLAAVAGVFGIAAVVYALLLTPIYRAEAVITPVASGGLADTASSLAGRFGGLASLAGIDLGNRRCRRAGGAGRARVPAPARGIHPAQ